MSIITHIIMIENLPVFRSRDEEIYYFEQYYLQHATPDDYIKVRPNCSLPPEKIHELRAKQGLHLFKKLYVYPYCHHLYSIMNIDRSSNGKTSMMCQKCRHYICSNTYMKEVSI